MQKLKKKYNNKILNYQPFLKNNNLKKNQFNFKKFLFENKILLKNNNLNFNVIEINNNENITLPPILNNIYTIKARYEDQLLFNYNLNSDIVINFNKIIFKNFIKKDKIIKGRIIGGNNEKIYIYIFGYIFSLNPKKLNIFCNSKKKIFNNLKKKGHYFFIKIIKAKQIIKYYKLRRLNFNIDITDNLLNISRTAYIDRLIENKKLNKNKLMFKRRNFSGKLHVKKKNK